MSTLGLEHFAKYETFVFLGFIMAILILGKLLGFYNISSDWFWLLASVGLIIEGSISYIKQSRFDRKYKIIERKDKV
jgi:hypothetical protein